jgi:hypothetical protein
MRNRTLRQGVLSAVREELLKRVEDKRQGQFTSDERQERNQEQRHSTENSGSTVEEGTQRDDGLITSLRLEGALSE